MQRSILRFRVCAIPAILAVVTAIAAAAAVAAVAPAPGGSWPQFRGPDRTGSSRERGLLQQWPAGGPKLLWKASGLGTGNSAPSVAGGRIFGMSYRGSSEVVWALKEATGKPLWTTRTAAANFQIGEQAQDGPGCTPTVVGDRLYALGASGDLVCLRVPDGKPVWRKNLVRDFGGAVPRWGYHESPLVDGDRVVVTPGGSAATLVALNRMTGAVSWKARVPRGDGAGYASAVVANVGGRRQYVQLLAGGVVGVSAADGRFLWRYDAPANRFGINCSTPIVQNDCVFAASGYNTGGGLAKLATAPGGGMSATQVYFTRNMRNHHGGMVLVAGYLYGFDESNLTCLDFRTGDVKWYDRSVGKGSVTYADGRLYARSEQGPVALVEANPNRYVERGRFEQPDRSGKTTWPYPVIANGRLYLRDHDALLSYNVKASGPQPGRSRRR
ncbi:MAG TPA: PQQ-binding-like beta-propeller repeat protein [Armatimonadota bacterium]